MVASAHALAAVAGVRVLADGGNAFDAALAAALVEGVVLPWACGLGGDMFCVLYDARNEAFFAINGSGIAPQAASPEAYLERGFRVLPAHGLLSTAVPGAVDAYLTLHERFCTFPLERLFRPAIELAADGFAISPRLAHVVRSGAGLLAEHPTSAATFLPEGRPPRSGELLRQPDLARTLDTLRKRGRRAFYEGEIAAAIVEFSRANGGLLSEADFACQRTEVYQPLRLTYRGLEVLQTAPPSQGLVMLEMLALLEGFELGGLEPLSAEAIHIMAEAKKIAFSDRLAHCGDPRFVDIPVERLLSKRYATRRRAEIDLDRAAPLGPAWPSADASTTYLCVADGQGNVISLGHSLAGTWASAVVAGETGILLNNRAGRGFTLEAGHPNRLAGGRRTMHTLTSYLVAEEGRPVFVGGTPGGDLGLQWNVQVVVGLVDHGLDPQAVIEAPRWHSFPGIDPLHQDKPGELQIEDRVDPLVLDGLRRRGHRVRLLEPWGAASAYQLVALDRDRGTLLGASDPRAEGVALGL